MRVDSPLLAAGPGGSGHPGRSISVLDDGDIRCATRTAACVLFSGGPHARTVAERIHRESGWGWGPFTVVDCGAPEATLDRELFGPLAADVCPIEASVPVLRLLQPGTMFLEEVGRLRPRAQAQLRDLLELAALATNEKEGRRCRRRVMASTTEPLLKRVLQGTFDETLFYRLNALHFVL